MPKLRVDERFVWAELLCLRTVLIEVVAGKRHGMHARKAAAIAGRIERLAAAVIVPTSKKIAN
ncbi:hypothetical protein SPSIL_058210 [Sporomusa silvacetica DSM 10669]|uniref:Uncharacterized protein n=1 Tax=Sporomusa silvacetica DSM 10669 TaxID=1123289 RepID=A0ABZ3IV93_9FIRM|nr:hypothetical protein [Sporomusa silvacetica]OZC14231.1 hypothetical protein SPSIL_49580 [Sporomusa silvacetica DSM 10669]